MNMNYKQFIKSIDKNGPSKYKVYALIINEDHMCYKKGDVFYIGITQESLGARRSGHLNKLQYGIEFSIILIENTNDPSRESFYINLFKNIGCNLLNKNNGRREYKNFKRIRMSEEEKVIKQKMKSKEYYDKNRDRLINNMNKYQEENKERLQEYRREYYKNRKLKNNNL